MHTKKQKILIISIGLLILLIGIGIGFGLGGKYSAPNVKVAQNVDQPGQPDFVGDFKVVRVIDGDTIEIAGGERVRYIGMDTPETVEPGRPVECFGPEATAENKKLVEGQTVRLEKDTTDRDKYDRLLRYVFVGDSFINLELVRLGFAHAAAYPPDLRFQAQFTAAQQAAEKTKTGLWSACQP